MKNSAPIGLRSGLRPLALGKGRSREGLRQGGFTVPELLVVCAITLILAGMMVPNVLVTMRSLRMRTSATEAATLLQQARIRAIRTNTFVTVRAGNFGNTGTVYMDTIGGGQGDGSGNGQYDNGETVDELGTGVTFRQAGNPGFNTAALLGFAPITGDAAFRVSWNQRGLPCVMNGATCVNLNGGQPVGYLYFLNDGGPMWSAVSVSPAGRVKTWMYTGTTWR